MNELLKTDRHISKTVQLTGMLFREFRSHANKQQQAHLLQHTEKKH